MKKLIAIALVLVLALSLLTACDLFSKDKDGGDSDDGGRRSSSPSSSNGGGKDGMFASANFNLPENVWIVYESSINGNLSITCTIVKIGNDLYQKGDLSSFSTEDYNKYNGKEWEYWYKTSYSEWDNSGTSSAEEVIFSVGDTWLNFMTSSWYYTDMRNNSKSGTESVAGVMCDKYAYTDSTGDSIIYFDPVSNLFLKADHTETSGGTLYEVVKWDTSVKSFADAGVSGLPG